MKCKNCKMLITAVDNGPKPYIGIADGAYKSFVCFDGTVIHKEGHVPGGIDTPVPPVPEGNTDAII
jgi:hypothetical protein